MGILLKGSDLKTLHVSFSHFAVLCGTYETKELCVLLVDVSS